MSVEVIVASVIASVAAATIVGVGRWLARKLSALSGLPGQMEALGTRLDELDTRLTKEFGGNSGGMRQAINGLQTDVRELRTRLDKHIDNKGATP